MTIANNFFNYRRRYRECLLVVSHISHNVFRNYKNEYLILLVRYFVMSISKSQVTLNFSNLMIAHNKLL